MGYVYARQKGSHVTMKKVTITGEHVIVIPLHDELDKGTLNGILSRVSDRNRLDKDILLELLREL
jgi:predicted RNA binding protein YcfA (HicA-like mRNA interferase family)